MIARRIQVEVAFAHVESVGVELWRGDERL
jgi:hypothetical protein